MLDRETIERADAASCGAPMLIALSGGGDSTALLRAMVEHFGAERLRALVVDHALRDGSAADARAALASAHQVGVAAEIATLHWLDGARRNQQAARTLRYAALCTAACEQGARVIALGHTADDQAETVFMRAAAGSSWRGLAGMAALAPAPLWPEGRGLLIARPLLGARRAALREALRARDASWIEDPANANCAYERVRVRQRLAGLEAIGFDPLRFARLAESLRPRVMAVETEASCLIAQAVRVDGGGEAFLLDPAAWRGSDEARVRALSVLISAAAGAAREPSAEGVARIEARLGDGLRGATLGGARLRAARRGVRISRDPGALAGRVDGAAGVSALALPMDASIVWDGRLALTAHAPGLRIAFTQGAASITTPEGAAFSLEEATAQGLISAAWLLEQHVQHRLSPIFTAKSGLMTREKSAAFTGP